MTALCAFAQSNERQLFIPAEWKNPWPSDSLLYKESDPDRQYTWSKTRSKESEHFICYWDKYYATEPTLLPEGDYFRVDIDDLLRQAEQFYALNVGELAFCDEANSNVSRYKMMILMNHGKEGDWVCYGGGYDDTIGALWLNPATCKPVGHSVAHEVGHSFQYQCFADLHGHAGFRDAIGDGSTFWEQTAQWQAAQAFPELKWDQSWWCFRQAANYPMTYEFQRYQSYWWHYYLAEKYGLDAVGRLWRHDNGKSNQDPNEMLMDMMQWDVNDLFRAYFDYALHMATLDLSISDIRAEGTSRIGTYRYEAIELAPDSFQVSYSSCPQSTGFNVVPLNVPQAGTQVKTTFTSLAFSAPLAEDDPSEYFNENTVYAKTSPVRTKYNSVSSYTSNRGFRLGYVALLTNGTRQYLYEDSLYIAGQGAGNKSAELTCTVPEGTAQLFLVVVPAPRKYYPHLWNSKPEDDDQWPYTVAFHGTNLKGYPNVPEGLVITDQLPLDNATLTYDVTLPATDSDQPFTITVEGQALAAMANALQLKPAEIGKSYQAWSSTTPSVGKMKLYATRPDNGKLVNTAPNHGASGFYFLATGSKTTSTSSAVLYTDYDPSSISFTIGTLPANFTQGETYTVGQALRYRRTSPTDGQYEQDTIRIVFRVTAAAPTATPSARLAEATLEHGYVTGITEVATKSENSEYSEYSDYSDYSDTPTFDLDATYDIRGQRVRPEQRGIVIRRGKKYFNR